MNRQRVVLAKLGLDGHDVGVRLIGKHLVDAGFEVVYLGKRVSTATIVAAAVQEDADAVGLSCLSGGLGHFAALTVAGLRRAGSDVPVLTGGIDEPAEIDRMMAAGVHLHFGPGTSMTEIVTAFQEATSGP
ncbi:cobalamin B12-binding domain-containing protein [Actinocrispum wychmicini]|uniref:Methylmalonyl-CoA mutase C-terminal domain/subunit n=1 Tax=Actinocrispum wychmicini TaxID=1213861 RepID=A0A4R2J946_9PSEU|nr:cobalamin-dependent protein [Actinocrispum wychmicini]TCO55843.1 methylmalonyl-CoA mutase C-terminal domain/subunit [Actinocrispum wychmicini]